MYQYLKVKKFWNVLIKSGLVVSSILILGIATFSEEVTGVIKNGIKEVQAQVSCGPEGCFYPTPSNFYPTPQRFYSYPTPVTDDTCLVFGKCPPGYTTPQGVGYSYPYPYPTPGYGYPTPGYGYPTPGYGYPTPSYTSPSYNYPVPSGYPAPYTTPYPTPNNPCITIYPPPPGCVGYSYPSPYVTPYYTYPAPPYTYPSPNGDFFNDDFFNDIFNSSFFRDQPNFYQMQDGKGFSVSIGY